MRCTLPTPAAEEIMPTKRRETINSLTHHIHLSNKMDIDYTTSTLPPLRVNQLINQGAAKSVLPALVGISGSRGRIGSSSGSSTSGWL